MTMTLAIPGPATAYRCPCCSTSGCPCRGADTTATTCRCCSGCCCHAAAYPVRVWCDDHDAEATREVWWTELAGTDDERGRTTPVCESTRCLGRALAAIAYQGGTESEIRQL